MKKKDKNHIRLNFGQICPGKHSHVQERGVPPMEIGDLPSFFSPRKQNNATRSLFSVRQR